MPASIPFGAMYVIQPLQHAAATRRSTVTYAVGITGSFQNAIDQADTAFKDNWDQNLDTQVTCLAAQGYYRANPGQPLQTIFSGVANRAGTRSSATAVSSVAVGVTKRTAFVGRAFRGRVYLPWVLTDADVDEVGNILPTSLASFQGHADDWLNDIEGSAAIDSMLLLHNYTGSVDPETSAEVVTALAVQPQVRTQRRRIGL